MEGGGAFPQLTRKKENMVWMAAADKSGKIVSPHLTPSMDVIRFGVKGVAERARI